MKNEGRYIGRWSNYNEMMNEFSDGRYNYETAAYEKAPIEGLVPTDDEVLFASYGGGSYEGDAVVIFHKGDTLYEVRGSHCSCYGLEDQWKPEKTSIAALNMREKPDPNKYYYFLSDHDKEAAIAYWKLVSAIESATPNAAE